MRAVFVIERLTTYTAFAPIVDAALARGWDVECWHDYSQPEDGLKGYQFPSMDASPRFANGRAVLKTYHGQAELTARLADPSIDAIVSTEAARPDAAAAGAGPRPRWVAVQHGVDFILNYRPERVMACDVVAMDSRWWLSWAGEYYAAKGLVPDGEAFSRGLEGCATFVGLPELDAARMIDPGEVRRRWGVPAQQPVVVLFPFPQGVGRAAFWPSKIYAEPSRLKQVVNVAAHRRFEYAGHVWHGWNDARLVRAIRRFCDRNGAYLLVKSRRKTPVPGYLAAVADRCLYDESVYPATILEALSIASLSISYFSTSVLESVALGVPHMCVAFRAEDYLDGPEDNGRPFSGFFNAREGGAFQYRGVSVTLGIPDALRALPEKALADFAIDAEARERYVATFLTHAAGDGAVRTVKAMEASVAAAVGAQ